ncbi:hypothetical protein [Rhizobium croatiense]|uniref:hypothetical protein n=1 Tax=Rhizobium croatiense TaxID=2867516 RepID=UPI0023EADE8C|nr:hypothetical protein [Rhizobium croatiense]WET76166.1 hypothetical protein PYR68_00850 [Rhizobium croatiense]
MKGPWSISGKVWKRLGSRSSHRTAGAQESVSQSRNDKGHAMALVELTENQLRALRAALAHIFEEIEDDAEFEELIGVTRWEAEELRRYLTVKETPA